MKHSLTSQPLSEPSQEKLTHAFHSPHSKLSALLWELDWQSHFPMAISQDSLSVEVADFEQVRHFLKSSLTLIHGVATSPFFWTETNEAKSRYYESTADMFRFQKEGETVGLFIANPQDWSTYYIRYMGLLPQYQGRGIFHEFLPRFIASLNHSPIRRIEIDISASQSAQIHLLNKLKFIITGNLNSERWGTLLRLTRFIDENCQEIFLSTLR